MSAAPLELSLGDVFEDVVTAALSTARADAAWADAAAALAGRGNPALALRPLRLLRGHRFQLPMFPSSAVPTLLVTYTRNAEPYAPNSTHRI